MTTMAQTFLAEFEREAVTTRKFLEQLPGDQLQWKPHEKSLSAGQLALHIAAAPGGIIQLAVQDEVPAFDFTKPFPVPASVEEVLAAHDTSVATVQQALPTIGDERMDQPWRAVRDGVVVLELPRKAVIRNILLNHIYHHRGQFGVYLRLLGAKVPAAYGPSGDETPELFAPRRAGAAAS